MAVDMVEVADKPEMQLDLRAAFVRDFGAQAAVEKITHPALHRVFHKAPGAIDQPAEPRGRQHALSLAHDEMKANVQAGTFARRSRRRFARRRRDHQARSAEHAVAMGAKDTRVDLGGNAEIVGGKDDGLPFRHRLDRARTIRRACVTILLTRAPTGAILLANATRLKLKSR